MASGDTLLIISPLQMTGPDTDMAMFTSHSGGSTPGEVVPRLAFDDTTDEFADFALKMPQHYGAGGVTVQLVWGGEAASTSVNWEVAFRGVADDAEDIDASHSYVFNSVTATCPSAIGEVAVDTVTFTDGVDMDSVTAGDFFLLRVKRDSTDSMTGDAYLYMLEIKET